MKVTWEPTTKPALSVTLNGVIVHGPQGCGKTLNIQQMRMAFGLKHSMDEWNGYSPLPLDQAGTLVLTNCTVLHSPSCTGYLVLPFDEAVMVAWLSTAGLEP